MLFTVFVDRVLEKQNKENQGEGDNNDSIVRFCNLCDPPRLITTKPELIKADFKSVDKRYAPHRIDLHPMGSAICFPTE